MQVLSLAFAVVAVALLPEEVPDAVTAAAPFFDEEEETEDEELPDESEAEARDAGPADATLRYTVELTDAELERRFLEDIASLGSISVGFADEGRLINSTRLPTDPAWQLVVPENAYGTQETMDALRRVARVMRKIFPEASPLRINHISKRDGGYLRPHKSHQSGRDVDLGFYYLGNKGAAEVSGRNRLPFMDLSRNWTLVKTLVTEADVQSILVDRKIIRALYAFALERGEDKVWLDSIFGYSGPGIIHHARGHRDHFHVRFFAPRSQELGRRVQPLLAKRPDENLAIYRIRPGDTLGHIAMRYNSTVSMIQKANRMSSSFLRVGRVLVVPLRGPCTRCPLPPVVQVPPRRLPSDFVAPAILAIEPTFARLTLAGGPRLTPALCEEPRE